MLDREDRRKLSGLRLYTEWRDSFLTTSDPNDLVTPLHVDYDVLVLDTATEVNLPFLVGHSNWQNRRPFRISANGNYNIFMRVPKLATFNGRMRIEGGGHNLTLDTTFFDSYGESSDHAFYVLTTAPSRADFQILRVTQTPVDVKWQFEVLLKVGGVVPKNGNTDNVLTALSPEDDDYDWREPQGGGGATPTPTPVTPTPAPVPEPYVLEFTSNRRRDKDHAGGGEITATIVNAFRSGTPISFNTIQARSSAITGDNAGGVVQSGSRFWIYTIDSTVLTIGNSIDITLATTSGLSDRLEGSRFMVGDPSSGLLFGVIDPVSGADRRVYYKYSITGSSATFTELTSTGATLPR